MARTGLRWLKNHWRGLVAWVAVLGMGYALVTAHFCGRLVMLRRQMQPGEVWRYTLTQTLQLNEQTAQLQLAITDTVLSVQSDGSALVERTLHGDPEILQILQEQMHLFGKLPQRMRLRFTPDGEEIPLQDTATLLTSIPYAFPRKAVAIGDEWERLQTLGTMRTRYRCRLVGEATVQGVPCWKIVAKAEPFAHSLPQIHGEVTIYLDHKRQWTRAMHGTLMMSAGNFQGSMYLVLNGSPTTQGGRP
ncbi:MAG: hypothetical protein C4337_01485 [Armatimonadota bacterium]